MPDTTTGGSTDGGNALPMLLLGLLLVAVGGGYATARHFKLLPSQRLG